MDVVIPDYEQDYQVMDGTILCIETSTDVCSAAVYKDGGVALYRLSESGSNHSQLLPRYIDELTKECRERGYAIDAVAVSGGPGSYTGLRIGVSTAKGLAYGLGVPLVAVPTLEILCERVLQTETIPAGALLCPMMDARRMEVYTALYDTALREVTGVHARVVENGDWLPDREVLFFGNGASKCRGVMESDKVRAVDGIQADARYMGRLAARYINEGKTADTAYFEPFYLKEFVAAPSHIKGLE